MNMKAIEVELYIPIGQNAALSAGKEIARLFQEGSFDSVKKSDNSPFSKADKAAHDIIYTILKPSGLPILSEEGSQIPYEERRSWHRYWLIDPVDGTKEFISGCPDFTVNIALIEESYPVLGVVYLPVNDILYWGSSQAGAWKKSGLNAPEQLHGSDSGKKLSIVVSKHHGAGKTMDFLRQFPQATVSTRGSSLKFMLLAEGSAQLYPRLAPTMEWDTAASQAILEAAGGQVLTYVEGKRLQYNKESLVNDWFVAHASSLYL